MVQGGGASSDLPADHQRRHEVRGLVGVRAGELAAGGGGLDPRETKMRSQQETDQPKTTSSLPNINSK